MTEGNGKQAVAYLRVSTDRQGSSGLGLEAQREAVTRYARDNELTVVAEYVEVETGKGANALARRPELSAALAEAKRAKGTLIVAKLDRLTRNTRFLLTLLDSGADVAFADLPHLKGPMGRYMVTNMAGLAELEAGMISERTKKALAAAKARGCKADGTPYQGGSLGSNGKVLAAQNKARALDQLAPIAPILSEMRERRLSMRKMVAELNERGIKSPANGQWHLANLDRALRRIAANEDLWTRQPAT